MNSASPINPAATAKLSRSLERELPIDSGFSIENVTELQGGGVEITALSSKDTLNTTTQLLATLAQLGYETEDNASRILEGVSYSKQTGQVRSLFIKVTMDTEEQCRVFLKIPR